MSWNVSRECDEGKCNNMMTLLTINKPQNNIFEIEDRIEDKNQIYLKNYIIHT